MSRIMIGKSVHENKSEDLRIRYFVSIILSVILACGIGIGLLYIRDFSNYKHPGSKIIKVDPDIDLNPESRHYCDTYHIFINLSWLAIDSLEKADEIRSFHNQVLTNFFGDAEYLDGQTAYPIFDYWISLPKSKYVFIDTYKIYSGAETDKYGSVTYIYSIDTRMYIGIFPKTNNSCPDHG